MDNRLVLTVLFVTLSWISVGTYAQVSSNSTAAPANMTSAPNATMATNMTSAPNATMATNMTSAPNATMAANMTSAPNATMATNMTSAPNATMATNMTSAPNATMATNMTSAPNTTMATNMTSAPIVTMATNTTAAPATVAPPLTPNTTVEFLNTTISNEGCGTQQLCAAEPSSCNPANSGSCFFLAAKRLSGQNFEFGLSGESDGYLAASLSSDGTAGGNDTTYICANNNNNVQFFGAFLNNGQLTLTELNVNSVRGRVEGNKIQCTFAATVPNPVTRAATSTSFSLSISTGTFNSTTGTLGAPNTQLRSPVVDLANPNTTVTNELSSNTTASPNTTSTTIATTCHAITLQQSLTQALLIIAGVLGLAIL